MAGAGAGDEGRGDGVDDDNAVGPVDGDPVDGEGEGEELDVAGVSDPTAVSSFPDAPVEQPTVVRVATTNAAARDRRAWWWGIGGSLPRRRGCKRARVPGSCDNRNAVPAEQPRAVLE